MNRAESSSGRIVERADGTVFRAKTAGLMVKLPASEDVTVAVQMSRLGLRNAGDISGETEGRRWTASLQEADGRVFETRATLGPLLSFCVAGGKNSGSLWQVHLDAAPGHPEGNLLVVTVIRGLVTLGGESVSNDVHPDVPGDDTYVGGSGGNLYTWELRGGDDTIVNDSAKSTLWIGGGTDLSAIGVERVGNDLVITLPYGMRTRRGWGPLRYAAGTPTRAKS